MKFLRCAFILVLSLVLSNTSFADCETLPPCTGEEDPITGEILDDPGENCCNDVSVPFDGGVSLILAAGIGIGATSIFKKKKRAE